MWRHDREAFAVGSRLGRLVDHPRHRTPAPRIHDDRHQDRPRERRDPRRVSPRIKAIIYIVMIVVGFGGALLLATRR
jgi:hypothetical protein